MPVFHEQEAGMMANTRIKASEALAEFIGSMFIVMAAISPIILFTEVMDVHIGIAVIANVLAVVFVLCVLIEMFAPISGAHFNPVVTMAMFLDKKIGRAKAVLYVLLQIAGGITGTVATHLMFYNEMGGLLFVSDTVRNEYMLFGEVFGTFILILAIKVLVKIKSRKISIMIALLVGGQAMATSSTMFANPQVTIARMFTSSVSGIRPVDGLVFIGVQVVGALLGYGVYRVMFAGKGDV